MRAARIGVKPVRSNALLLAQKKNGRAVINDDSLKHFEDKKPVVKREGSPTKGSGSSGSKGKEKAGDGEADDEDSGDEAEKLDEQQMNEIDEIYRK